MLNGDSIIVYKPCEIPNPGDLEAMASTYLMESEVEEEKFQKNANKYKKRKIKGAEIVTHHKRIVIPKTLRKRIVAWYRHYLAHPGMTRLEATLRETMTWPNMRKDMESHVRTCPQCQKYKKVRPKYGKLPEKQAEDSKPCKRVDLDDVAKDIESHLRTCSQCQKSKRYDQNMVICLKN
jgi:hypothetical protein